ncbi:MAG TPA: permease prefix domain 1-containing protein [Solirubrobacteraceae bacterium]|nr:permease prefix domain 1-containing protein [Solirubrobacteraceae bacterium]
MNEATDNIGSFLQAVAARLPGPRIHRAAILAELHDGLLAATESNQQAGHEHAEAVRLALAEFGDARTLAAAFRPELMIARCRQTALALFAATALVVALWLAAARSRHTRGATGLFDSPVDHLAAAVLIGVIVASGLLTLVTTGRPARRVALPPQTSLLAAVAMGLVTALADLAAVAVLGVRLAHFPGTIHALALTAAITGSCTSVLLATRASWSCATLIKAPQ